MAADKNAGLVSEASKPLKHCHVIDEIVRSYNVVSMHPATVVNTFCIN